jgi:hypothetical protein
MNNTPFMTSVHALAQYHLAYDNNLYADATDAVAEICSKESPEYARIANLITDAALEFCGHPAYHGVGWTLALELREISKDSDTFDVVIAAVDAYLSCYRNQMQTTRDILQHDPVSKASFHLDSALHLAEEAVGCVSQIPYWNGRAAYHLTAAGAGLLRTAAILLKQGNDPSRSTLNYAAEKFNRALRDLSYGLDETANQPSMPEGFVAAREHLNDFFKED